MNHENRIQRVEQRLGIGQDGAVSLFEVVKLVQHFEAGGTTPYVVAGSTWTREDWERLDTDEGERHGH